MGTIALPDCGSALVAAVDDKDLQVQIEATRALGRFGESLATDTLINKLIAALSTDRPNELRHASLGALEAIAPDREPVVRAAVNCLAKDPSALIRHKAVALLKGPNFDFVIPGLCTALEDSSAEVRLAAGANLARIGMNDDRVVPALQGRPPGRRCHA